MLNIETAGLVRPIQTEPEGTACGDATLIVDSEDSLFLALLDGAGHGVLAANASKTAITYLKNHTQDDLCELLEALHQLLRGTRGAVAGLCRINKTSGELHYSGTGNISTRLFSSNSERLVSRDGMLGHQMVNPKLHQRQLSPGDVVMLYSDGVTDRLEPIDFSDFFTLSAYDLARITIDYHSKTLDDASCLVARILND